MGTVLLGEIDGGNTLNIENPVQEPTKPKTKVSIGLSLNYVFYFYYYIHI